jgi:hypothetical protein
MADLNRGPHPGVPRRRDAPEGIALTAVGEPGAPGPPGAPDADPSPLFLLRLWRPEDGGDTTAWEGRIQHVLSGAAASFADLELLAAALHTILAALRAGDADARPPAVPPCPTGLTPPRPGRRARGQ